MKRAILALSMMILILNLNAFVQANLSQNIFIPSTGSVQYPPLVVRGRQIVDRSGNPVLLRGFSLWWPNVFQEEWHPLLSPERFREIKSWGFNTINIIVPWAQIERDPNQIGVYDESRLQRLDEIIQWAQDAGLYVVISIRVMNLWWDMPTAINYTFTEECRTRYGNFLEMIVKRFDHYENVIGYNGWHFPYHGYGDKWSDPAWEESYYNYYTPIILEKIRSNSRKIIFYSPIYQGGWGPRSEDTGAFDSLTPLPDNNVVYCHKLHRPYDVEHESVDWDYNYDYIRNLLQPAFDFQNKYNVPMACWEFGMEIHGAAGERPIRQSRLDCLDYKLQLMDEQGNYSWVYWIYTKWEPDGCPEAVLEEDGSPTQIIDVLRNHLPS